MVAVGGEDLVRGAAAHVVAVVAAPGVVVDQPGVDLGLELADRAEASTMKRGTPAFLQGGALEAFNHGVVVRRPGWDPPVDKTFGGHSSLESDGVVFGAVVGQHRCDGDPEAPVAADHRLQEPGGHGAVGGAQDDGDGGPAGGGVDGGELVHLADALEVPM